MSCALWLKQLGFRPLILDREPSAGGQLRFLPRTNRWILGFPGHSYPAIAEIYAGHIHAERIPMVLSAIVRDIEADQGTFRVRFNAGDERALTESVAALVLATGARPKTGETFEGVSGWETLAASGRLSFFPLDHLDDSERFLGARVAVVGGGDNAYFTAKDLAAIASKVHLLVRSRPKAQAVVREVVEHLAEAGTVRQHFATVVTGFSGSDDGIHLHLSGAEAEASIVVDHVFVRTGFLPNSDFVERWPALADLTKDDRGYLKVDGRQRTSVPLVYAIGDVANRRSPSAVAAMAEGALAARTIADDCGLSSG
jgi:thioredoxin reductase